MRLDGSDESKNIEDRRGNHTGMGGGMFGRGGGMFGGGRGGGGGGGGKKFGLGTIVLILVAIYFGVDPNLLLQMTGSDAPSQYEATTYSQGPTPGLSDAESRFVAKVLKTTEDAWGRIFQQQQWGPTPNPSWCYTADPHAVPVAWARRRWALFIVRPMKRFTWI